MYSTQYHLLDKSELIFSPLAGSSSTTTSAAQPHSPSVCSSSVIDGEFENAVAQ